MRQALAIAAADPGLSQVLRILDGVRNALMVVLGALAIAAITYAGVRYVIANGDPSGVEKAKGAVKSAVLGLALAILAPVVVAIVKQVVAG